MNPNLILLLLILGLSLPPAVVTRADDWPQWRGPNRDGVWRETGILESFPPGGLKLLWRAPVGPGFSSPVVAEGRVYLIHSALMRPKAKERVQCFNAATGKVLWTFSYDVNYPDWAFTPEPGMGPAATPLVLDEKLYTLGDKSDPMAGHESRFPKSPEPHFDAGFPGPPCVLDQVIGRICLPGG